MEQGELGITGGLQDRVVQTYAPGCIYMDFDAALMRAQVALHPACDDSLAQGFGKYEHLNASRLPTLFLAYLADPSDSGQIHNNVRRRYEQGDPDVLSCALQPRDAPRSHVAAACSSWRRWPSRRAGPLSKATTLPWPT